MQHRRVTYPLYRLASVVLAALLLIQLIPPQAVVAAPATPRAARSAPGSTDWARQLTGWFRGLLSATAASAVTTCELYPIALHSATLAGVAAGDSLGDIYNGVQPGNFGWLSWAGDVGEPALVASLTPPGDSAAFVNAKDPADTTLSAGDWAQARPGVVNSRAVRAALDQLLTRDIIPVSDQEGRL